MEVVKLCGAFKDILSILDQAIAAEYGDLPAVVAIRLYMASAEDGKEVSKKVLMKFSRSSTGRKGDHKCLYIAGGA